MKITQVINLCKRFKYTITIYSEEVAYIETNVPGQSGENYPTT